MIKTLHKPIVLCVMLFAMIFLSCKQETSPAIPVETTLETTSLGLSGIVSNLSKAHEPYTIIITDITPDLSSMATVLRTTSVAYHLDLSRCTGLTEIPKYAFYPLQEGSTSLREAPKSMLSAVLPATITSIGDWAFYGINKLSAVNIPEGVASIGNNALGFTALTTVIVPAKTTVLAGVPFDNMESLTSIEVAPGNTAYQSQDGVLLDKEGEKLIKYPRAKTGTTYTIPATVKQIGGDAFSYCKTLTSVTLPSGLTSIGRSAFYACNSLSSIDIPATVTSIGSLAFGNTALTTVTIPAGVVSEDTASAFKYIESLTRIEVELGNTAYQSQDGVFLDKAGEKLYVYPAAKSGTTYTVPDTVKEITSNAFEDCKNLDTITLPAGLTTIGGSAFSSCENLTAITIPDSVKKIDGLAFYSCTKLSTITIQATTPPTLGYAVFGGLPSGYAIKVPANSLSQYKAAEYWKDYNISSL